MRKLWLLVLVALTSCESVPPPPPDVGEDLGSCSIQDVSLKETLGTFAVLTIDASYWQRLVLAYGVHSTYSNTMVSQNKVVWVPPHHSSMELPHGFVPSAVNECEKYASKLQGATSIVQ